MVRVCTHEYRGISDCFYWALSDSCRCESLCYGWCRQRFLISEHCIQPVHDPDCNWTAACFLSSNGLFWTGLYLRIWEGYAGSPLLWSSANTISTGYSCNCGHGTQQPDGKTQSKQNDISTICIYSGWLRRLLTQIFMDQLAEHQLQHRKTHVHWQTSAIPVLLQL